MIESTLPPGFGNIHPRSLAESYPSWRALGWFLVFRLCIAAGLFALFVPVPTGHGFGDSGLTLVAGIALAYAVLVLLGAFSLAAKRPSKEQQVQIAVFLDIVAFTLLMHGTGGVQSGLGLLLAIAVTAGALLMEGRLSLLFASFATLGVITVQVVAQLHMENAPGSLTRAGLLGITFFSVSMLAHVLYRRIQEAEQLAARRQVDIADLSQLNEFIIQSMNIGVLVVDQEQRLRLTNAAALRLLGLPPSAEGERLRKVAPELSRWLSSQGKAAGPDTESAPVLLQGQEIEPTFHLLGEDTDVGAIVFLRDKRELIREAQQIKLASLGRLTASIAHNIRNPLSAVSHAGQLLAESPAMNAEDQRLLDIVRRNAGRIDDIVESVLQLSRRNRAAPRVIELGHWLREFCNDLGDTKGLSAERLRLLTPNSALKVRSDPRHLHQILTNLCDNALDHAVGGREPVKIRIRARRDPIRGSAVIEVLDDGPGIDPETAREIFNPFFSTNPGGTGLGLYIAKELSETNGAELEYISQQKRGTCFRLTFPC